MVQLDKRRLIWELNNASSDILQLLERVIGNSRSIQYSEFMSVLIHFGFEDSPTLHEILGLALESNSRFIDIELLFQVIGQAVSRIMDRNALFWNTVMTVSSSSIAWVDFRRKLSKWLAANGKDVLAIKRIVSFVQDNVEKHSPGLVRKEAFLKFTQRIMGVDCLLDYVPVAPSRVETIPRLASVAVRPMSVSPDRESIPEEKLPTPKVTPRVAVGKVVASKQPPPVVTLKMVDPMGTKQPSPVATLKMVEPIGSGELVNIRVRLGAGILEKLVFSRIRWWFVVDTICSEKILHRVADGRVQFLIASISHINKRLKHGAFSRIAAHEESHDVAADLTGDPGPSWAITIQAVAVTNLFGIMRSALTRATLPALLNIRAGRRIDRNYPPPTLFSQAKQGRKDAEVALLGISRGALQPINENRGLVEFDLSH